MLPSVTAWAWPGESPSRPVSSRSAPSLDGLYAAGSLATDPRAAEGRSAEPRIGVAAVAEFTLREGPDQSVTDSFAYRLLRDQEVFAWPSGAGEGGLASGIGAIALPDLTKSRSAPRHSTQLMIANMVPLPGFTDFAIVISDQNGVLDYVLEKLNERQVEYVDLDTWGYVNDGFQGSAVLSAMFWEHDVFDDEGEHVRNLVGLSAVLADWSTGAGSFPGSASARLAVPYDSSLGLHVSPWDLDRPIDGGSGPAPIPTRTATPGPSPTASATPTVTPTPTSTPTAIVPPPCAPDVPELLLPALQWRGPDASCDAEIEVLNAGAEAAVAALVLFGEPGECGTADCAGPAAVICTDAVRSDGTAHLSSDHIPDDVRSGLLYSLSNAAAEDIGLEPSGGTVADVLCPMLAAALPGSCAEYERFKVAYDHGADYDGVPMRAAWGAPLAASVDRACEAPPEAPDLPVNSSYSALWGPALGHVGTDGSSFVYSLPIAHGGLNGLVSQAHVQNAGDSCVAFSVWALPLGGGEAPQLCAAVQLEAGAAEMVDMAECIGEAGSAWVESDGPLAVVADTVATDAIGMSSYVGAPPSLADMHGRPLLGGSGAVALAPGVYGNYLGWSTRLAVQNSGVVDEVFRVSLLDRSGDVLIERQVGPLAPRSSFAIDVPSFGNVPDKFVGSALVESFPLDAAPVATPWEGPVATARPLGTRPYPGGEPTRTPGLPLPVTPGTPSASPTATVTAPVGPSMTPLGPTSTAVPERDGRVAFVPRCDR